MKLEVAQKKVGVIESKKIDKFISLIDEQDWFLSDYRQQINTMTATNSIPLMHTPLCASGLCSMKPIEDIKPQPLYEKYKESLDDILLDLSKYYKYKTYSAFITRLKPYGVVGKHIDVGNFLTLCHRIHIPLLTNPKVAYVIDEQEYYWESGNIYEFDNTRLHGVINRSDEYRVHLIINLYPQELLSNDLPKN